MSEEIRKGKQTPTICIWLPYTESLYPPAKEMSCLRKNRVDTTSLLCDFLKQISVFESIFPYLEAFFTQNHTESHEFF